MHPFRAKSDHFSFIISHFPHRLLQHPTVCDTQIDPEAKEGYQDQEGGLLRPDAVWLRTFDSEPLHVNAFQAVALDARSHCWSCVASSSSMWGLLARSHCWTCVVPREKTRLFPVDDRPRDAGGLDHFGKLSCTIIIMYRRGALHCGVKYLLIHV